MKKTLLLAVLAALLSGCGENVDDVDTKAVERWQALVNSDYKKAYEYIAPSYRELEDLVTYQMRIQKAQMNIQWNGAEFMDKDCTEDACSVNMKIDYTYKFSRRAFGEASAKTDIKESWIKDGGKWYYLPKKSTEL